MQLCKQIGGEFGLQSEANRSQANVPFVLGLAKGVRLRWRFANRITVEWLGGGSMACGQRESAGLIDLFWEHASGVTESVGNMGWDH